MAVRHPGAGEEPAGPVRRAGRSALPAIPGGWGIYATLVAFGVAVSITGYYATDQQEEAANRERALPAAHTPSITDLRSESAAPAPPPVQSPAVAEGFSWDAAIAQSESTLPRSTAAQPEGASPGRKSLRDARSAGVDARQATDASGADPEPPSAPTAAGNTAALSGDGPAPEAQPSPNSDRRQVMAAALSRCERENFFASFVCKERAWLQFCDGQWGEVPQCPSGVRSNGTR